jgi:predicted small lipoprotein YifL
MLVLATLLMLAASGCGKKGALTPPAESSYPQMYPKQ